MYKSPIELVVGNFQDMIIQQQENQTLQAIQKIGVNVDKEELLKALKYDRGQYSKGFNDGVIVVVERLNEIMRDRYLFEDRRYSMFVTPEDIERVLREMIGDNDG